MKKCDYCAKEISYYDQYCDENCEKKALDFYSLRDKYTKVFSILNIIGVFGIPVGLFLPFPVENMISSMKIKKAVFVTRMIGAGLFALGVILFIIRIIFFK